jgi:hypothetical protein
MKEKFAPSNAQISLSSYRDHKESGMIPSKEYNKVIVANP